MADDDKDLVSQVKIEGTDEATQQLVDFANKGGEAFDKLGDKADSASKKVDKSTDQIGDSAKKSGDALNKLGKVDISGVAQKNATQLNEISRAMEGLTRSAVKVGKDLASFATRVAGLTAAAAAAATGIGALAVSVAKSQNTQASAFEQTNKAQQAAVQTSLSAEQASLNLASQQRQLNDQLARGTITYDQFSASMDQNRSAYKEQIRATQDLEFAQESARIETERLQKQLADRKVYQTLIDTYGGPLASALTSLGNSLIQLKNDFMDAFGPGIAQVISIVTDALSASGSTISQLFSEMGQQLSTFVQQNGPAIRNALVSIGTAFREIFTGVLNAMPQLLNIFNNQLVPAFVTLKGYLDSVRDGINSIFGTNFSTGALVIIAILGQLTGSFKLLFGTLQVGIGVFRLVSAMLGSTFNLNPIGLAIGALIISLTLLYSNWDRVVEFITTSWGALVAKIDTGRQQITDWFSNLGDGLKQTFDDAIQWVQDKWQELLDFFSSLPETTSGIFTSVGQSIIDTFNTAIDTVTQTVTGWVDKLKGLLQPIIDMINAIAGGGSGSASGGGEQSFSGGGRVRGPGTSTSDSIAAWLSNNEFVMRAKAVRKYGVSFMRAINSGTLNLDRIQRFAAGGLVSAITPVGLGFNAHTAMSGGAGGDSGGILNLSIDGQSFDGLRIPDRDTAEALVRYTVQRRMTSGGKPPAWSVPRR